MLAARELLSQERAPDGVFCVTDPIACGFIDAARHEFGLCIPENICVIGFDDIEQASWLKPLASDYSPRVRISQGASCLMRAW